MFVKNTKKALLLVTVLAVAIVGSMTAITPQIAGAGIAAEHEYAKITRDRVTAALAVTGSKTEIKLAEASLTGLGWFVIYGNGTSSAELAKMMNDIVFKAYNGTDKMNVILMNHTSEAYFEMLNLNRFEKRKPDDPSDEYSKLVVSRIEKAFAPGAGYAEFKLAEGSLAALGWMTLFGNDANSKALANQMATKAFNEWRGANEVYMLQSSEAYAEMINLGRFKLNARSVSNPTPTTSSDPVEEQYWDAVKNSSRAQDFQSYLTTYPNGKYATIARTKLSQTATNSNQARIPVSATLRLQSDRIPLSRTDPAYTIDKLDIVPAIYLDVTFSDGTKIGPFDYKKNFASNVIFDDVSGDPNDIIKVSYWDVDSKNPSLGKYAAQLTSTGNGVGTAYLKVSLRNAPNVTALVQATVVSSSRNTTNTSQTTNLALRKSASQSSDLGPPFQVNEGLASIAVDGNTNGNGSTGQITHTACGGQYASGECKGSDNPWWSVDLGTNYNVNKIQIWNRTDCCSERLTNYRIWTKSATGDWEEFSPGVKTYNPGEQYPLSFSGNKQARYVMIQLTGKGVFLSLAEVKVFGSN